VALVIASMLTDPKRGLNSLFDLPRGALPGAQADNGNVCTCVESNGLCSRHWNWIDEWMVTKSKLVCARVKVKVNRQDRY
jgi:hypothetical protein